ncbi:YhdP family protein [Thalassotalea euphylliae]|uniref:YhdP family protein n=1 Tax=Thalassotalea euphylliae TaxID=1655234 RepID=UPI00362A9F13
MNIAAVSNRWLNRLYKSIAILLVLFAVLISAFRLFLPYATHYKDDFQDYINTTYQTNVQIGALSMQWHRAGPILIAKNVSLVDTDEVAVFIRDFGIEVNFWESLRNQALITRDVTLGGAKVYIDVEEIEQGDATAQETSLIEQVSDLFLVQIKRFSLSDSQLIVGTIKGDKQLDIPELNWVNSGQRHKASGEVVASGISNNSLKLLLDLHGTSFSNISGQAYVSAKALNVTSWLDRFLAPENEQTFSVINFDAWLNISEGKPLNLQLVSKDSLIQWNVDSIDHELFIADANINIAMADDAINIKTSPIKMSVNEQSWQPFFINTMIDNGDIDGVVSEIDIAGVSEVIPLFVDDPALNDTLTALAPKGAIQDIHFRQVAGIWSATAELNNYQNQYFQGAPGIDNVFGSIAFNENKLHAEIESQRSALNFDKDFKQPIAYNKLNTEVLVTIGEEGVDIDVLNAQVEADNVALTAQVNVSIPTEGEAGMALFADIERANADFAHLYYPHLLMGDDLVDYLNASLKSGKVSSGKVLFNGKFTDFPFNQHEGIFVVDAELKDAEFQFDSSWPAINNMAANLNFTNNGMLITARSGELQGLNVRGVTAEIADLSDEQLLLVKADIDNQLPKHVTALMNTSPLKDSVGETLTQLVINKPISGYFQLDLPLNDSNNTIASGYVDFNDNELNLETPEMVFANVNGRLSYSNEDINTRDLTVMWRGMPLGIDVTGAYQSDYYQVDIGLDADWQQTDWQQQVPATLQKYLNGVASWQGELALFIHDDGGFSYNASLNSSLEGAEFLIPEPYRKAATDKVALNATVTGTRNKSNLEVALDDHLSFYGVLSHEDTQFKIAHLVLGKESMLLPMDGFHITTALHHAEFSQWNPFIFDILDSLPEGSEGDVPLISAPERIRGNVDELGIFGQKLTNISFNLLDKENWWLLRLNAKEARTDIKFYPDWLEQGVDVDADFIHFTPVVQANDADTANLENSQQAETAVYTFEQNKALFDSIPRIKFDCDSCKLGRLDMGHVSFDLERADDMILLNNFKAERGKTFAHLEAGWLLTEQDSTTTVSGKLNVRRVEREMEAFDYQSTVKDSGMKSDFSINWRGSPRDFEIAKLNGDIKVALDDGYLADVNDKGARILSVLSLQSLVRKLTLDFRDIFSDGLFYSSITGDATLQNGVLYTDNVSLKGPAGTVTVKGNTDLTTEALDYSMSLKPNLTSNLPVLAWIATLNPVTFLAGVAIDEVITSRVVSEFNFELTGTMSEPNFREVDRKTRDVTVGRSTPPQFVEHKEPSEGTIEQPLPDTKPEGGKSDG